MHPDDTAPNPIPFASARGWHLAPEHTPTDPARLAELARIARGWQLGLTIGLVLTAPALALCTLFALTAH